MEKPKFRTNYPPFAFRWYQTLCTFMIVMHITSFLFDRFEGLMRFVRFFLPYPAIMPIQMIGSFILVIAAVLGISILRPIVWEYTIGVVIGTIIYVKEMITYLAAKRHDEQEFADDKKENHNAHDAFMDQAARKTTNSSDKPKTMKDVFGG